MRLTIQVSRCPSFRMPSQSSPPFLFSLVAVDRLSSFCLVFCDHWLDTFYIPYSWQNIFFFRSCNNLRFFPHCSSHQANRIWRSVLRSILRIIRQTYIYSGKVSNVETVPLFQLIGFELNFYIKPKQLGYLEDHIFFRFSPRKVAMEVQSSQIIGLTSPRMFLFQSSSLIGLRSIPLQRLFIITWCFFS